MRLSTEELDVVIGKANRSQTTGRVVRSCAAVAASVLLLAGCAAGQRAQTSVERAVIDGVNAQTTNVSINNLSVSAPANGASYATGDNAPLQLVLVNTGTSVMQLSSVTVDPSVAASATVSPSFLPDTGVSTSMPAVSASSTGTPSAGTPDSTTAGPTDAGSSSTSQQDATSASPSAPDSAPASASAPASVPIPVPVGSSVRVGLPGSSASIVLNDLAKPLYPAENITIAFNFSDGESVSVLANVHLSPGDSSAPTLPVSASEG